MYSIPGFSGWAPYVPSRGTSRPGSGTCEVMQTHWPEWQAAIKIARNCMATLYMGATRRGMGVFMKPDVLLIPRHLLNHGIQRHICGSSLEELVRDVRIQFNDDRCCYPPRKVLSVLEDGGDKDYCLIELAESLPACIPQVTYDSNHSECLFAEIFEDGEVIVSVVFPCSTSPENMCSSVLNWTRPGSCGGIYLDRGGRIIGIHLSQAKGICDQHTGEERKYLFAHEIVKSSPYFSTLDQNFCPVPQPLCLTPVAKDLCYVPQVDVRVETKMGPKGYYCKATEIHITNSQRGIHIEIMQKSQNQKTKKWVDRKMGDVSYQIYLIDLKGRERDNIHPCKAAPSTYTTETARDFYLDMAEAVNSDFATHEEIRNAFRFNYKNCDFVCRLMKS